MGPENSKCGYFRHFQAASTVGNNDIIAIRRASPHNDRCIFAPSSGPGKGAKRVARSALAPGAMEPHQTRCL